MPAPGKWFNRNVIGELRRRSDKHLFFQDGGELLGEDFEERAVDGAHPTALGFMRIANGLPLQLYRAP